MKLELLLIPAIFLVPGVAAQVVTYEADGGLYPEDLGWEHVTVYAQAERWLDGGWLVQRTEQLFEPTVSKEDFYQRSIPEFAGSALFVESRVQSEGRRAAIEWGSTAAIIAAGYSGISFDFRVVFDQAAFFDPYGTLYLFDIVPNVPHVYRLEVRGKAHSAFIDGQLVCAGLGKKVYPTANSLVFFGPRAPGETATTRWDYIRFGVIPDPAGPGDTNCDGTINLFDIDPFVQALIDADGYGRAHPACNRMLADTNADGTVNIMDIDSFVALLTS